MPTRGAERSTEERGEVGVGGGEWRGGSLERGGGEKKECVKGFHVDGGAELRFSTTSAFCFKCKTCGVTALRFDGASNTSLRSRFQVSHQVGCVLIAEQQQKTI